MSGLNHMPNSGAMEMMNTTLLKLWKGWYKKNQDAKDGTQTGNNRKHPGLSSLSSSHCIEIQTSLMTYFQGKHYYLK